MAYLAIYAISVLIAYFGYVQFCKSSFEILHSQAFSEDEKNNIYKFSFMLHELGGYAIYIPILNFILAYFMWYLIAIERFTRD
jgi:hypothetical protein